MKTARRQSCDEKEPFGPGSRDYFWLVCRLIDNIRKDDAVKSWQEVRKNMLTEVLLMLAVNILQIQYRTCEWLPGCCEFGLVIIGTVVWLQEGCAVGLDALMRKVAQYITNRPFHEKRHNTTEDDGLIGLLHLAAAVIKHEPPFKTSNEGKVRQSNTGKLLRSPGKCCDYGFCSKFPAHQDQMWHCSLEGISEAMECL